MGLPERAWVEKKVHDVETHCLSGKEKVPGGVVSKEVHAEPLLDIKDLKMSQL